MSMFGYHPDYPGPDSPRFTQEHLSLLRGDSLRFALELLERFPHLKDKVYLGQFGISARRTPDRFERFMNRFGIGVSESLYHEVMIDDFAENGLHVYTMEHDEYIDFQLILDNGREDGHYYWNEDTDRNSVLAFLTSLYSEEIIAFRSYFGSKELDSGTIGLKQLDQDPASWSNQRSRRKQQGRELRHLLRSWHGTHDQEITSIG